jgi:hypothetical protein
MLHISLLQLRIVLQSIEYDSGQLGSEVEQTLLLTGHQNVCKIECKINIAKDLNYRKRLEKQFSNKSTNTICKLTCPALV